MMSTLVLAVAAMAMDPAAAAPLDSCAKPAAAVVDRFHQALRSGDLEAAARLLDDSALIYESGGIERSKAEYQAHHLPADAAFSRAVPSVIASRSGGAAADLAWVATESRTKGTFKGKPIDSISTETMVLRQKLGVWKIVHIHWSSGAAPKR